jgi:hypothetical protein
VVDAAVEFAKRLAVRAGEHSHDCKYTKPVSELEWVGGLTMEGLLGVPCYASAFRISTAACLIALGISIGLGRNRAKKELRAGLDA